VLSNIGYNIGVLIGNRVEIRAYLEDGFHWHTQMGIRSYPHLQLQMLLSCAMRWGPHFSPNAHTIAIKAALVHTQDFTIEGVKGTDPGISLTWA